MGTRAHRQERHRSGMTMVSGEGLRSIYENLGVQGDSGSLTFETEQLSGIPYIRLGRNDQSIALLFESDDQSPRVPISLRHLGVLFNTRCRVHDDTGPHEGTFTVVTCDVDEDALVNYF